MSGGIIQLVAYGKEDLFLTRDPQITFFKIVYRRHTNFAVEEIEQNFTIPPDFGKQSTCIISQDGDLINKIAIKITLPAIPKFSTNDHAQQTKFATKFAWAKYIGFAILKYVEIEINGQVIDRHYGEWLYIWTMLTARNINDGGLNKLIGNVPELTDFTDSKEEYILYVPLQFWFCRAPGLSIPVINLLFSDIKINIELYELDKCFFISPTHYIKCNESLVNFKPYEYLVQKSSDNNNNIERYGIFSHYDSINKKLYYTAITEDTFIGAPLPNNVLLNNIYTNNNINNLNLRTINSEVSTRYGINQTSEVSTRYGINQTSEVSTRYGINQTSETSANININMKNLLYSPKVEKYNIRGISSDFVVRPDIGATSKKVHHRSLKNISLKKCVLLVDYVFIDDDERFKFAQSRHDYLIEQLYFTPNITIDGSHPRLLLTIDQPCKLTVWLAQLDYIYNFNDRFNYTDSHIRKRPYDIAYTDPTKIKLYNNKTIGEEVGKSLFVEETLKLNSQDRLSKRPTQYFEYLEPFQHAQNQLPDGVGMYSYAIYPTEIPPSGATNMGQIELIELQPKMSYKISNINKAKFRSYSLCYNIWRTENGISATIFIR
jgi:hypothetical protein